VIEIPPITRELGKYWEQPQRSEILLDENHAVMSRATFQKLAEYSTTVPTGVYEGKMWRRREPSRGWLLAWYGPHPTLGICSINLRQIVMTDDGGNPC
jgi:hypothetical protein